MIVSGAGEVAVRHAIRGSDGNVITVDILCDSQGVRVSVNGVQVENPAHARSIREALSQRVRMRQEGDLIFQTAISEWEEQRGELAGGYKDQG